MRKFTPTVIAAVLLIIGVLAGSAISQATFNPAKIGFVDMDRIFKEHPKAKEAEARAQRLMEEETNKAKAEVQKLREKASQLEVFQSGTPEYQNARKEIEMQLLQAEFEEKWQKQQIAQNAAKEMGAVYTEVTREAENYARRNGLDAVLMVNSGPVAPRSLDQLGAMMASRPVLYWNGAYDVTAAVLAALNK